MGTETGTWKKNNILNYGWIDKKIIPNMGTETLSFTHSIPSCLT